LYSASHEAYSPIPFQINGTLHFYEGDAPLIEKKIKQFDHTNIAGKNN
jgi:hypothetical protein